MTKKGSIPCGRHRRDAEWEKKGMYKSFNAEKKWRRTERERVNM